MRIGIIGAGLTGLAAAWDLSQEGHQVTIFEEAEKAGGLARGFTRSNWDWWLDEHYHHLFTSDRAMHNWLAELGLDQEIVLHDAQTKSLIGGQKYQLDSPLSLLKLPMLSFWDKARVGVVLAFFKLLPTGQWLERFQTQQFLRLTMGSRAYRILWRSLMEGKFGDWASRVNLAWFWARIKARTKLLGYPKGGFQNLIELVLDRLRQSGVKILLSTPVTSITRQDRTWQVEFHQSTMVKRVEFDQVLITGTNQIMSRLAPDLPASYLKKINQLKILGAVTLILELDQPFFDDETYWLNICDAKWPFLAVVEHTNLIDRIHYGNRSLVYVGNYLPQDHKLLSMTADQLLAEYQSFLEKLKPDVISHIQNKWVFASRYAQPVVETNHSRILPVMATPLPGLFWCGLQHVYPWDRGANYAVKAGRQVAQLIINKGIE
ncbi:MAG: FAD-dependent oxidoreductase [Patescibacteria group bacterium]